MSELETHVARVWSPDARPLVEEAWRCYNAGAVRSAIAATWTAVTADVITKLIRLADDGDARAAAFRDKVQAAQGEGITPAGVRAMQQIEDILLDQAEAFELIDSIARRELERIRQDRNLCVHPSLRGQGDVYDPRPEVARGHLAVALTALLIHPPTQGRRILDEFTTYVCDPHFVPTTAHIQATFFDRVRSAARRNIVNVATKHALLELSPPATIALTPAEHADRMATTLKAFALRDRDLVRRQVDGLAARFQPLEGGTQLRALLRLGDQDFFWDMVDPALADRLNQQIGLLDVPATPWEPLAPEIAAFFALVRDSNARQHLPTLEERFAAMDTQHQMSVAAAHPDPYFVPTAIASLAAARGFRIGERAGQLIVQHAPYLSEQDLRDTLTNWATNDQCRIASLMPDLAVSLFHATARLSSNRVQVFQQFLTDVGERAAADDTHYTYPDLCTAVQAAQTRSDR